MMDRAQIIAANPLSDEMERRGIALKGNGIKLTTNRCGMVEHKLSHQCVDVDAEKGVWYCHDCKEGGSVIDFIAHMDGVSPSEVLKQLGGMNRQVKNGNGFHPLPKKDPNPSGPRKVVATYNYTDESGKLLFCVCRFDPKGFGQKAPDGSGGWIYKLDGVRRVLFNLPAVIAADFVWIVEGEKDANTLNAQKGFVATTNCGGAEKWTDEYSKTLKGKEVAIIPDNDDAGQRHLELLKKSLAPYVRSIRVVKLPAEVKDVTEFMETYEDRRNGYIDLVGLVEKSEQLFRGHSVPVQSMEEMEEAYREHIKRAATHRLQLSSWLPSLADVRPLVPGELMTILAGTGCGKTALLQNLAIHTKLPTLFFEVELPDSLSFERFVALSIDASGGHVESTYATGQASNWRATGRLGHINCVHKSQISIKEVQHIIETAELKTSVRPVLVLIDYIQLIGSGESDSRYEKVSSVAEGLKGVAKATNTIIIIASQIGRDSTGAGKEVSLTSGKESGSIENSSGFVLGAWRDGEDSDRLWVRVLKNTKGKGGRTIPCRIKESLRIYEEAAT